MQKYRQPQLLSTCSEYMFILVNQMQKVEQTYHTFRNTLRGQWYVLRWWSKKMRSLVKTPFTNFPICQLSLYEHQHELLQQDILLQKGTSSVDISTRHKIHISYAKAKHKLLRVRLKIKLKNIGLLDSAFMRTQKYIMHKITYLHVIITAVSVMDDIALNFLIPRWL